jgi:signal transduction histidine kinase
MLDVPGLHTRLYAMRASDDPSTVVVAGVSLALYDQTRRIALIGSLALALALLLVVSLVARWMLKAALQPVAQMTADAESWSEHELDRRFAAGEPYDELSQLAATLDGLLDRVAASLRREQRFSAEMSHELRTPLAKVRAEAELALRRERPPAEYHQALETILRNTQHMTAAIETLVTTAQQESGLARGRCEAGAVLAEVAEMCSGLAAERGIRVVVETPASAVGLGVDREVAVRVLQPLAENACVFARGEVRLAARREGSGVLVTVDDDGPGVCTDEAETIFEPGVRGRPPQGRRPRPRPGAAPRSRGRRRRERAAERRGRPLRGALPGRVRRRPLPA